MEWWFWVIIVGVVLAAVLAFFEWRSRNKPLGRGIEGVHGGIHENERMWFGKDPFGTDGSTGKPRDY